uniref:Uncharacterized protein n=1 Tax=Clytia hemisphaerica TaxID=252671 RepID=A0A7M5UXW6_9CNID
MLVQSGALITTQRYLPRLKWSSAKLVDGLRTNGHTITAQQPMAKRLDLDSLDLQRDFSCLKILFDCVNGFKCTWRSPYYRQEKGLLMLCNLIHAKLKVYENSFPCTIKLWNSLDNEINMKERDEFRNSLTTK